MLNGKGRLGLATFACVGLAIAQPWLPCVPYRVLSLFFSLVLLIASYV
jgi:hypothetical protein